MSAVLGKIRKALREMLIIGALIGIVFMFTGKNIFTDGAVAGVSMCLLTGLLLSVPAWAVYRLLRFALTRS